MLCVAAVALCFVVHVVASKNTVDSVSWLDYDSPNDFMKLNRPVVIRDAPTSEWPAMTLPWSLRSFAKKGKHMRMQVKMGHAKVFAWGCCPDLLMSLAEMCDRIENSTKYYDDPESPLYIYSVQTPSDYQVEDEIRPEELMITGSEAGGTRSQIWMGTSGVVTPLHADGMPNFFLQVVGRKRFRLYSPESWAHVYVYPKFHLQHFKSQVAPNITAPDLARYPLFAELEESRVSEVVLEEGDLLFMPIFWFHQVETLAHSISVNTWSPSPTLEDIDKAWEEDMPMQGAGLDMKARTAGVIFQAGYFVRRLIEVAIAGLLNHHATATEDVGASGETFTSRSLLDRKNPFHDFANKLAETRFRIFHEQNDLMYSAVVDVDSTSGEFQLWDEFREENRKAGRMIEPAIGEDSINFKMPCHRKNERPNTKRFLRPELKAKYEDAVERIARHFVHIHEPGISEVHLGHYIEDFVARLFGEENIYPFLTACVVNNF